ncbi:MAG: hypothetical protein NHB15_19180 [Methanosarcina barkeri]|nr:hypothetical protein [Methanosarcina sp. ERenArc_MAG2]
MIKDNHRSLKMKKSSVVLIIIVSFICLVCSGCISSHIVASEEKENSSGEISKSYGDQASNQLNQENIHSSEKSSLTFTGSMNLEI